VALPLLLLLTLAQGEEAREVTPGQRRWIFLAAMAGLAAFYVWGLGRGCPDSGTTPARYGDIINRIAVAPDQGDRRGLGGQLLLPRLRHGRRGVHPIRRGPPRWPWSSAICAVRRKQDSPRPPPGDWSIPGGQRLDAAWWALIFAGPVVVMGWFPGLARTDQPVPAGFQGGVVLATAFFLIYLSGGVPPVPPDQPSRHHRGRSRRQEPAASPRSASPPWSWGLPYLKNFLPLGATPGGRELVRDHRAHQLLRRGRGGRGRSSSSWANWSRQTLLVRPGEH